jgi:hypothetical protein
MPFDATMKNLAAGFPRDFVAMFDGEATRPACVLNVDLSTVTTSTDFVAGLGEPVTEIVHLDFQSSADEGSTPTCWSTTPCCTGSTACRSTRWCCCSGRRRRTRTSAAR